MSTMTPFILYSMLLLPLLAMLLIGLGMLSGKLQMPRHEAVTASVSQASVYLTALLALLLAWLTRASAPVQFDPGISWLQSGEVHLTLGVVAGGMHSAVCAVFALIFVVVFRFSAQYMHRENGFHRFFLFLNMLVFAMLLLVLSANAVLTFVAWELAGISSWFLIGYTFSREQAAVNGTRVFIIQRIGDGGFLLGLILMLIWTGTADWYGLAAAVSRLTDLQATLLALTFMLPAFIKSAQFPFTPWLFRAMEGPTPSSTVFYGAVMVHAGVFLVILLEPLFERSFTAMLLLSLIGLITALYGYLVGRSQTDIKTSMACATASQTGLMFLACGLGLWTLALWHLAAHAIVRCYLFLRSPSILHNAHNLPVTALHSPPRWLQAASLQQGWVDPFLDCAVVRPVCRLARDLAFFEARVLDPLMGIPAPAVRGVSAFLQRKEAGIGARLDNEHDSFGKGSGVAGKLTDWVAGLSQWFEDRFILEGVGRDMISLGRRLGHAANRFERLLLRPRYLVVFVLVTLLVAM